MEKKENIMKKIIFFPISKLVLICGKLEPRNEISLFKNVPSPKMSQDKLFT